MKKALLFCVLILLSFLLVACAQQEVTDRPIEEDLLEGEDGAITGQAIQIKSPIRYIKCVDSDGNDPYNKGTITGSFMLNGRSKTYRYTDSCWNNNKYVIEYTCEESTNKPVKVPTRCLAGCSNGACVRPVCTDSDGGDNIAEQGTTTGPNWADTPTEIVTEEDYCITEGEKAGNLAEFSCELDEDGIEKVVSRSDICPAGQVCQDGACVASCTDSDGDDLTTRGTTTGLNADRNATITTQDYCTQEEGGAETSTGPYVVEGQCLSDGRNNANHVACPAGMVCDNGACVGAVEACVPKTECIWQEYAGGIKECGIIDDGCGGTINCNYQAYAGGLECPEGYSCNANQCEEVNMAAAPTSLACGDLVRINQTFEAGGANFQYRSADRISQTSPKVKFNNLDSGETYETTPTLEGSVVSITLRQSGWSYRFVNASNPYSGNWDLMYTCN